MSCTASLSRGGRAQLLDARGGGGEKNINQHRRHGALNYGYNGEQRVAVGGRPAATIRLCSRSRYRQSECDPAIRGADVFYS